MGKTNRPAGQNIRELALQRRIKAVISFGAAIFLLLLPFLLNHLVGNFLVQLSFGNSQQPAFQLPAAFYLLFVVASLGSVVNGLYWWRRANHAAQGAQGEEDVAKTLAGLAAAGWKIEYGLRLGNGLGDADIVCLSPRQKAYVIDVKSHRGRVATDGQKLYRWMGNKKYPFEKDFLKQVMKQALQVKQQQKLKFVTPILAFSNAKVLVSVGKLQNVYVVEKARLSQLLEKLG